MREGLLLPLRLLLRLWILLLWHGIRIPGTLLGVLSRVEAETTSN